MPLRISCPEGHTLVVSQARAGSTLRCPKCSLPIVIPPPAPVRNASLVDVAMSALVEEQESAVAVAGEPVPPPVVSPPVEVTPPPIWTPPPKSRAIVEPAQEEKAETNRESIPAADQASEKLPQPESIPIPVTQPEPVVQPVADAEPPPPVKPEIVADVTPIPAPADANQESNPAEGNGDAKATRPELTPATSATKSIPEAAASTDDDPPLVPAAGQQVAAWILSLALAAAALFGAAPAIWDLIQYAQAAEPTIVPRWALALIAIGIVQIAYAVYLAQLPDWTSGWIVTLVSLALAALYAGMLGITLIAGAESSLVRGLDLGEVVPTGRAAMWCLCMTTILSTLAFFAGRSSFRWKAAESRQGYFLH